MPLYGQTTGSVSKVGTVAAPFLEIGIGSKAESMGGAFVAIANDASALYWNPSGIATLPRSEVIFMHSEFFEGFNFDFFGIVMPLGSFGTVGGRITSLGTDELEVRTVDRPDGTGEFFNSQDLAVAVSYARNITDRFSIGFNFKFINQRIWRETAQGFGIDIGTLFVAVPSKNLRIGATLTNLGTKMKLGGKDLLVFQDIAPDQMGNNDRIPANLQTDRWPLPLNFQFGVAMDIINGENNRLTISSDFIHPSDNNESINLGSEYNLSNTLFIRAGYRNLFLKDNEEGLTFGGGIGANFLGNVRFKFDYSYTDFGRLNNVQRFTLGVAF
jgi:hypothetical protein